MPRQEHGAPAGPPAEGAPAALGAAAEIERQVESERIANLHALIPPTLVGGSAFACIVASILLPLAHPAQVLGWLAAKLIVAAVRGVDVWHYRRTSVPDRQSRRWRSRLFGGLWVDAVVWSLLPLLFLPTPDAIGNGLMVAAMVGVVSVGAFSLAAHRLASIGFMTLVLGPLAVQQLLIANRLSIATATSLAIFAVVLFVECERNHRRFSEMLRLRFENAAIAEDRRRALIHAEHSAAARTHFLASVSHELRTPLNGILGMAQLMADEDLSPMQRRSLQVVQHSAEHLVSVIGDLLDLSRIEVDRITLAPAPALVAETVHDVADLLKPVASEKCLAFQVAFHPSLPKVAVFDAGRVKQVLHNLIGNAIKFTSAGEIRVIVRKADAQTLSFEVRDTGEGIPPDALERIFEPFEQLATGAPARAGAGLGLTISRRLARAMGGDVTCRSVPGRGARFRFTIAYVATDEVPRPRRELPDEAPPDFRPSELEAPEGDVPLRGRVLIVEDNDVNALVVKGMLDQAGVASERVTDGRQALDAMEFREPDGSPRYDLVLMDCQMPELDGWAATRMWRERERQRSLVRAGGRQARAATGASAAAPPRLAIIALTASAAAGERERCLDAGMDDYLSKPFTRDDLVRAIRPHLVSAREAERAPRHPPVGESEARR